MSGTLFSGFVNVGQYKVHSGLCQHMLRLCMRALTWPLSDKVPPVIAGDRLSEGPHSASGGMSLYET